VGCSTRGEYITDVDKRADNDYLFCIDLYFWRKNFGFSAGQKKVAAKALLVVCENRASVESLRPYIGELSNGRLKVIFQNLGIIIPQNNNVAHLHN